MTKGRTILLAASESTDSQLNGAVYRKQIARFGKWVNPLFPWGSDDPYMTLDKQWAEEMIANFNKKVVERVPVPVNHTDDTSANAGEVVKLELSSDGSGLDAYIEIRRDSVAAEINDGLIFDVSMSFDWDYVDTEQGNHYGVTLLHVALVNNPYLTKMKPFETVKDVIGNLSKQLIPKSIALSNKNSVIMLSESKAKEINSMDEATVKNTQEYDVTIKVKNEEGEEVEKVLAAGEETTVPKDQSEDVLQQIADAEAPADDDGDEGSSDDDQDGNDGDDEGSEGDGDDEDEDEDDDEKSDTQLSRAQTELARYKTKDLYNTLLSAGKIVPAQKAKFMELSKADVKEVQLSNGKKVSLAQVVADILQAGPQVVKFSEDGSSGKKDDEEEKDGGEDKKPSENLSEAESAGMKAVGADTKRMDELAEKYPEMRETLKQIDSNKENK